MISLCRAFGSREVLTTFTQLHQKTQAIAASLRDHLPPVTATQAQGDYREHAESKRRRDLCWDALVLVYTVQPMMANEIQGEIHPLPSVEEIRSDVGNEETLRN